MRKKTFDLPTSEEIEVAMGEYLERGGKITVLKSEVPIEMDDFIRERFYRISQLWDQFGYIMDGQVSKPK